MTDVRHHRIQRDDAVAARNDGMRDGVQHETALRRLDGPLRAGFVMAQPHVRRQPWDRRHVDQDAVGHARSSGTKAPGGISAGVT